MILSQWALESGFATSKLAKEALNFGGIKYRAELQSKVPGVSPFQYDEGRGEDDKVYFKSDSIATFIKLYWAFIERRPYVGWRKSADNGPIAFLQHIVSAGYVGGSDAHKNWYIDSVTKLMAEVGAEFNSTTEQGGSSMGYSLKGVRIAFDCGHGYDTDVVAFDPGAVGNSTREADAVQVYADIAATELKKLGAEVSVFRYVDPKEKRYSLSEKGARSKGHHLFVSCHLNAFNGTAQGTEALYYSDQHPEDKAFAQSILSALVAKLGLPNRGVKTMRLGVLSSIPSDVKGACLIEPFFIDAKSNGGAQGVKELCIKTGYALADGILAHCKKIGLGKIDGATPAPIPAPSQPVPAPKTFKPFWLLTKDQFQTTGEWFNLWRCKIELITPQGRSKPIYCRTGARGAQEFLTGANAGEPGSLKPIPQGKYKIGSEDWGTDISPTNKRDNYNGSLGPGLGPVCWFLAPLFEMRRSAFFVHWDSNFKESPGTAGCPGISHLDQVKEFVALKRANPTVDDFYVDWGLPGLELPSDGFVVPKETAEPKPEPIEASPTPAPIEPKKKGLWAWLLEFIAAIFSSKK